MTSKRRQISAVLLILAVLLGPHIGTVNVSGRAPSNAVAMAAGELMDYRDVSELNEAPTGSPVIRRTPNCISWATALTGKPRRHAGGFANRATDDFAKNDRKVFKFRSNP